MTIEKIEKKSKGGPRPGAGRPKGSASKRTREIADRCVETGRTPLEVMLAIMEALHRQGDLIGAAAVASKAAPFVHARLSAIEVNGMHAPVLPSIAIEPAALAELINKLNREI